MARKIKLTSDFPQSLDDLFSSDRPIFALTNRIWNPPTNIYETQTHVVIRMEVAGMDAESVSVTVEDRRVIVKGQRLEPTQSEALGFHLLEIQYGRFERAFEFPHLLRGDAVKAAYQNGFLCVEIPKQGPSSSSVVVQVIGEDVR